MARIDDKTLKVLHDNLLAIEKPMDELYWVASLNEDSKLLPCERRALMYAAALHKEVQLVITARGLAGTAAPGAVP